MAKDAEGKLLELRFPVAGLDKRMPYAFQDRQRPLTSYDMLNMFPDGAIREREGGGSRRGQAKFSSTQMGSGNPMRLCTSVRYTSGTAVETLLITSSNGSLYKTTTAGTTSTISSSCTLQSDRQLMAVDFQGKLYIADHGPTLTSASDGVITGASDKTFTSATSGNFASTHSVNANDHAVWITAHNAVDCVQTVTIDATGGTFILRDDLNNLATAPIAENAAASAVEDALELVYGTGNVSVSGSSGGPYTVTFQGDLAGTPVPLMAADEDSLTGGASTATVAMTTPGATTTTYAGVYDIFSVVTTTITLVKSVAELTGVVFKIARCPKVYDPVANTLSKWLQDDYTAIDAPSDDLVGAAKGAIPIGRSIIATFHGRIFLAGGVYSPGTFDCCRIGDAHDWDFSSDDVGRAVDGSVDDAGRIAEPITALIPHEQSCMLIGGKGSLWVLRGDITAGEIVNLDPQVGILDRFAHCTTAQNVIVFLSTNGIYGMPTPCGGKPVSLSKEKLPQEFRNIDPASVQVSFEYCHDMRAVLAHFSTISTSTPGTSWWLDVSLSVHNDQFGAAFFPVTLADDPYEPFCLHAWRDLITGHSKVMYGCRDGYVRQLRRDLSQDDGSNFSSYVTIGPIKLGDSNHQGTVNELYSQVPANSGDIDWTLYVASQPELLPSASSAGTGEWNTTGRTPSTYPRRAGNALSLKLANGENNARWEMELVGMTIFYAGRVRP